MTLGFAAARLIPADEPIVAVAADSRVTINTINGVLRADIGIKTYELGGRAAMVAAGHTVPSLMAAPVVRSIIENHNEREPSRAIGFYDTVRLLAFFLKRAAEKQNASCQIAVAGFLQSGAPAVAYVEVSPQRKRAWFDQPPPGGIIAIPVGASDGKRLLLQGFAVARREGRPAIASGIALCWYMSQVAGAFDSIGGGISIGTCGPNANGFSWPIIEIAGRRFLRGMDVTAYYRPTWPAPMVLEYDETWCAALDQAVAQQPSSADGVVPQQWSAYDVDSWSSPETLFQMCDDPVAFDRGIAPNP